MKSLHSNVSLNTFAETFAVSISERTCSTVRVEVKLSSSASALSYAVFARS